MTKDTWHLRTTQPPTTRNEQPLGKHIIENILTFIPFYLIYYNTMFWKKRGIWYAPTKLQPQPHLGSIRWSTCFQNMQGKNCHYLIIWTQQMEKGNISVLPPHLHVNTNQALSSGFLLGRIQRHIIQNEEAILMSTQKMIIGLDKSGYQVNSFLISLRKHIWWVLVRSASLRRF